jgi:hypothetical protein
MESKQTWKLEERYQVKPITSLNSERRAAEGLNLPSYSPNNPFVIHFTAF